MGPSECSSFFRNPAILIELRVPGNTAPREFSAAMLPGFDRAATAKDSGLPSPRLS